MAQNGPDGGRMISDDPGGHELRSVHTGTAAARAEGSRKGDPELRETPTRTWPTDIEHAARTAQSAPQSREMFTEQGAMSAPFNRSVCGDASYTLHDATSPRRGWGYRELGSDSLAVSAQAALTLY